jgi:subtilisin family serine protease
MGKGYLKKIFLIILLIILGVSNNLFASPRVVQFERWCDSLVDDEIIIKFKKNENSNLQNQNDLALAPNFSKEFLKLQKSRDSGYLKKQINNLDIKPVFSFDDEDFPLADQKLLTRKNSLLRARAALNLDRIYSLKINSQNYFSYLIPENQKRIYACREVSRVIKKLQKDSRFEYVVPNRKLDLQADITDEYYVSRAPTWPFNYETQWGLKTINIETAWSRTYGKKALIAVIDSGVDFNNPQLWKNIHVNPRFVQDRNHDGVIDLDDLDLNGNKKIDTQEFRVNTFGYNTSDSFITDPMDKIGHGTHVAGIIAAAADGIGMVGVAPESKILIIRVSSKTGSISEKAVARAIILAAKQGADVANLSMGTNFPLPLVYDAIKSVRNQMVIVAAAGNSNSNIQKFRYRNQSSFYPAAYNEVISVGAVSETNQKAPFSNYGQAVDILAPGGSDFSPEKNILSTDITSTGYSRRAGTSMAAPYVTGVVGLILATKPSLKPLQVKKQILAKATTLSSDMKVLNAQAVLN